MSKKEKTSAAVHPLSETVISALLLIALPILNSFVFTYIRNYYANDIFYGWIATVTGYISTFISALLPFIAFGVTIGCVLYYGLRGSVRFVVFGYISLLIPYLGQLATDYLLSSGFRAMLGYNLAYTALNYLAIDAVIMTLSLLTAIWAKKRESKKLSAKTKKPYSAIHFAAVMSVSVLLAFELGTQIYYTAIFIYELMYEYYTPITLNELIAVVTDFLIPLIKAAAGYAVIRLIASRFEHDNK